MSWKEIFKDDNKYNEKSIIGFCAFLIMTVVMIADVVTGWTGNDLVINESRTRDKKEKKLGLAATARLVEILGYNNNKCILRVSGLGKFGRALASVFVDTLSPASENSSITEINVNKQLIEEGHAVAYYGGKR